MRKRLGGDATARHQHVDLREPRWGIVLTQYNRGYATEAAAAAMDWAFDTLGWGERSSIRSPRVTRSRALLSAKIAAAR